MSASRGLCCLAVLLALLSIADAKTYFIEEDLGLIGRDALQKLLGYPALIEPDDPQLEDGIGASLMWTYYLRRVIGVFARFTSGSIRTKKSPTTHWTRWAVLRDFACYMRMIRLTCKRFGASKSVHRSDTNASSETMQRTATRCAITFSNE